MDTQRLKELREDFNELVAQFNNSKNIDEKLAVLEKAREVIAEVDTSILQSQKRLQEMKQKLYLFS
jgi:septal ring factor EnvC (AmiA/AmiB activator)